MNQKIQAAVKQETNRKPAAGLENDKKIIVLGARVNNLKNIDVEIPRNSLTVITGLSGSGKVRWPSIQSTPRGREGISKLSRPMPVISWTTSSGPM